MPPKVEVSFLIGTLARLTTRGPWQLVFVTDSITRKPMIFTDNNEALRHAQLFSVNNKKPYTILPVVGSVTDLEDI
jgi:hypothetical protein